MRAEPPLDAFLGATAVTKRAAMAAVLNHIKAAALFEKDTQGQYVLPDARIRLLVRAPPALPSPPPRRTRRPAQDGRCVDGLRTVRARPAPHR